MTRESQDRRAAVLAALRAAPGGVSGARLAESLGVSRVAVRKHVAALAELGYGIEARPGEGYRLVSVPDAALPFEVERLIRPGFYTRPAGGGPTGSTNDDAKVLAVAGAPEGSVVIASEQRAGRGRLGREWASPAGGMYVSVVLRPEVETPDAIVLPLVVGLGAARGLETLGADVRLKWPNDILLADGRKLAGVLLEGLSEGWRISWIVAGIGVNVHAAPEGAPSVSLDEVTGESNALAVVAAAVLDGVADAYREWQTGGFAALRDAYETRSWLRGRDVKVSDAAGRLMAAGRVAGVDGYGRLVVDTKSGPVEIASGDVTLREGQDAGA